MRITLDFEGTLIESQNLLALAELLGSMTDRGYDPHLLDDLGEEIVQALAFALDTYRFSWGASERAIPHFHARNVRQREHMLRSLRWCLETLEFGMTDKQIAAVEGAQ